MNEETTYFICQSRSEIHISSQSHRPNQGRHTISKNSHKPGKRLQGDSVLLVASDDHNLLINYNILADDVTSSHLEFLHPHFDHDKICALTWRHVRQ